MYDVEDEQAGNVTYQQATYVKKWLFLHIRGHAQNQKSLSRLCAELSACAYKPAPGAKARTSVQLWEKSWVSLSCIFDKPFYAFSFHVFTDFSETGDP